jgi:hypothetical protein
MRPLLLLLVVALVAGCTSGGDKSVDASQAPVTLTVRRELPSGPIWEEGSTMVVRIYDGAEMVEELHSGDDYEPAVAVASLRPGTYRVEVAQLPCVESCRTANRDAETAECERAVTIEGRALELVAEVSEPRVCRLVP